MISRYRIKLRKIFFVLCIFLSLIGIVFAIKGLVKCAVSFIILGLACNFLGLLINKKIINE